MSDEWHYSHKNESGHDVNAYGYDKYGVHRGTAPFKNYDNNQPKKIKKSNPKVAGGGSLVGLIIIIFIIIKVLEFLEKYWVYVVAILSIVIICIIFYLIIKRKLAKESLATFSNYEAIWTCPECGDRNPLYNSYCKGCGKYKPVGLGSNVSENAIPSIKNVGNEWTCKECNEINPLTASNCKSCGAYK